MEARLLAWFDEHGRDLPWRRTRDPYAILVSEVMLQQTQVSRVVPRYLAWLARWPTVEALAAAPIAEVIREWQGLGYNRRAVNLHRAAQRIAAEGWPDDLTELPESARTPPTPWRGSRSTAPSFPWTRTCGACSSGPEASSEPPPHMRSWTSARRSAWRGCLAASSARSPTAAVARTRYEPLRKQSRFEGSFRQRRARALRLVAEAHSPMTASIHER